MFLVIAITISITDFVFVIVIIIIIIIINQTYNTVQKWSFSLRNSAVNVTKFSVLCSVFDFVHCFSMVMSSELKKWQNTEKLSIKYLKLLFQAMKIKNCPEIAKTEKRSLPIKKQTVPKLQEVTTRQRIFHIHFSHLIYTGYIMNKSH